MIKKGIILSGGLGTRMSPLTKAVNKQLLPIYDKPLIYYSLSVLMLSKIREILIIVNEGQVDQYKKILSDGKNLGLKITYKEQNNPKGIPDAFILGEKFIGSDNVALILGDNFFYGQGLSDIIKRCINLKSGAIVLLYNVSNPELFGVAKINKKNKKIEVLKEKPKKYVSNQAVTGIYFFDNDVIKLSKKLKPSNRNELEIIDLLNKYRIRKKLYAEFLGRGSAWLDAGSIEDYYKASAFVQAIENRQGLKIACIEEIAYFNKWINKSHILKQIQFYGNCSYSDYLKKILEKKK
ncbi:sugar phosphate nucleotidyltransferase [Candidatus Pelagibacter ubique]|nr:sugar phosphate nucleotidyltransferase [Candidatus Pelagibacter ubique]